MSITIKYLRVISVASYHMVERADVRESSRRARVLSSPARRAALVSNESSRGLLLRESSRMPSKAVYLWDVRVPSETGSGCAQGRAGAAVGAVPPS